MIGIWMYNKVLHSVKNQNEINTHINTHRVCQHSSHEHADSMGKEGEKHRERVKK